MRLPFLLARLFYRKKPFVKGVEPFDPQSASFMTEHKQAFHPMFYLKESGRFSS